jgi:hypothetical protein
VDTTLLSFSLSSRVALRNRILSASRPIAIINGANLPFVSLRFFSSALEKGKGIEIGRDRKREKDARTRRETDETATEILSLALSGNLRVKVDR